MINYHYVISPLSVNMAWQGRRFKSKEYKEYERELLLTMPKQEMIKGDVGVVIEWSFKYPKKRDIDNAVKPLLDLIVKKGWIEDDRKIQVLTLTKVKAEKDGFTISIFPFHYVEDI